jgi:fatty acid desaturase
VPEDQTAIAAEFPLQQAGELVRTLSRPKPVIYWLDFLFHVTLGWAAFIVLVRAPAMSGLGIGAGAVAVLALYRAVIFTHEIAHMKRGTFVLFRFVWNATCGLPLLAPSFLYDGVHNDHHLRKIYGTHADGEYLPFSRRPRRTIIGFVLLVFVVPALFAVRFVLLVPLSLASKRLGRVVWERMSSLTIDPDYRRPVAARRDDRFWRLQEVGACLYAVTAIGLVVFGIWPVSVLIAWYVVSMLIALVNTLRTLAAHAYRNPGERPLTRAEEFLDSVNVPGIPFVTSLWAPVGLRFHATHHLFPSLPYHELARAHRVLSQGLADNRLYLAASRRGLCYALSQLWAEAGAAQRSLSGDSITRGGRRADHENESGSPASPGGRVVASALSPGDLGEENNRSGARLPFLEGSPQRHGENTPAS